MVVVVVVVVVVATVGPEFMKKSLRKKRAAAFRTPGLPDRMLQTRISCTFSLRTF